MSRYGYPKYVSVADKKIRAEKTLKKLRKKNPMIRPVTVSGSALATTWWGKAWNANLESYSDFEYRLGRGRSYVRHSAVLDLQIKPGKVTALVQGSESTPYAVTVTISTLIMSQWKDFVTCTSGQVNSVKALMNGELPKAMAQRTTSKEKGLFPSPSAIAFDCSCPDSASMCKHVAAALYGVGTRLDEDPALLFLLRNVKMKDLISETVKENRSGLLENSKKKSKRVMDSSEDLSDLFGIDLDDMPKPRSKKTKQTSAKTQNCDSSKQTKPQKSVNSDMQTPTTAQKAALNPTGKSIANILEKHPEGLAVARVLTMLEMEPQKVRNTLFQMKQKGLVESPQRGVYRLTP